MLRDVGFRDSVRDCIESLVSDFSPVLPSATSAGRGHAFRVVCSPDITLPSAVATATVHTEAVPRIRTRLAQTYVPKHRPMAESVTGLQYLVSLYTITHCSVFLFQIYDRPADIRIMIACVVAIAVAKVDEPLVI